MNIFNTRLTTFLVVIGTLLASGCDSKEDAGVKAIARFKDLTPPPFSDVVSHKSDVVQEWVKKDAFGTPLYTVMKTRQSPVRIPLYSITDWHRSPISDSHPFDQPGT
ncbi:YfjS/YafY family lipoprotein [Salmonella sp. CQ23WZ0291SAL]|uniref:YfjS/YafY family lipoprotein n=1 Tax=Salmonella sp. CQ23WZ0291SAL TaxID=3417711 RepID=UPI003D36B42E